MPSTGCERVTTSPGRIRFVFFMPHGGALRNFWSVVAMLSERGHSVHVAVDRQKSGMVGTRRLVEQAQELAGVSVGQAPGRARPRLAKIGGRLRLTGDVLRYLDDDFREAPALRARAEQQAGPMLRRMLRRRIVRRRTLRRAAVRFADAIERRLPADRAITAFLDEHGADVVLVTPLVEFASGQAPYVRAARRTGRPCALLVHSWDNLTNKGLIHEAPDLVTVWNEAQRDEAVVLHGVRAENVAVTGAPGYDHWFERRPSRDRAEFCERAGLNPARPYVLWACSSSFVASDEPRQALDWIRRVRAHDGGTLSGLGVLIRPHPQNMKPWAGVDAQALEGVVLWPGSGTDPVDEESRADYFDSIYHAVAVTGINTSALVEAAIVGRPVHTIAGAATAEGTLHFRLLMRLNTGFLRHADDLSQQVAQLAESLSAEPTRDDRFLRTFMRPHGLEAPATPRVVSALEGLGA